MMMRICRSIFLALPILGGIAIGAQNSAVPPISTWTCPESHPIKGNLTTASGDCIYHLPLGRYYAQTKPEICFDTARNAREAGCRPPRS